MGSKKEEERCWPYELGHIEGNMLIPWVKAMGGKIACLQIVEEIVERRYDWVGKEVRPGDRVIGVKVGI